MPRFAGDEVRVVSVVGRWLGIGLLTAMLAAASLGPLFTGGGDASALQAELPTAGASEIVAWWVLATRNTMGLVIGATLVAMLAGTALGALAVYGGAAAGGLFFRFIEFVGAVPGLILVGVLRLGDPSGGVLSLLATLSLLRALEVTQLVRAQILATLPSDFVEASRALGGSRRWQIRVHVLPRVARPLGVNMLVGAASLIGLEAALSFTGLGVPRNVPSWGGALAVLTSGGNVGALACVVSSIGLTSTILYGLGSQLANDRQAPPRPSARGSSAARLAPKATGVKGLS